MFQKVCVQCRRMSPESSPQCPGCGHDLSSVTEVRATASRRLGTFLPGNGASAVLLLIGQFAAVLTCIVQITVVVAGAAQGQVVVVGAGILGFCLSAAMLIVYGRIHVLPQIIAAQDAENDDLWQAIARLRSERADHS